MARAVRAIDGHRLGNGDCPKTTWIEGVNLTGNRSLGDSASKCLAGGRAAAGIDVVADAGNPGACRLRLRHCGEGENKCCQCEQSKGESDLVHIYLLLTCWLGCWRNSSKRLSC